MSALSDVVKESWHRFLDVYEPHRTALYRYGRSLTGNPFDADDLVQDTMARAFMTLGCSDGPPANPRAWLFRVATNLWIDRVRGAREAPGDVPEASAQHEPQSTREAVGTLFGRLSPKERAAVVLKDVFDLTLEEIASTLQTTVGGVKAALHGGRGRLAEPPATEPRQPSRAALDAFCAAFNAGDVEALAALLLDTATVEVVRVHQDEGKERARHGALVGMLHGLRQFARAERNEGMDARYLHGLRATAPRCEVRTFRGEPVLLYWHGHEDGEYVRAVNRVETDGERISRFRNYFYTPDVIEDVCQELGVPCHTNGYRYW